jgi:hypothetical protein
MPPGRALINSTGSLLVANDVSWGVALVGLAAGVPLVVIGGRRPVTLTGSPLPGGGVLWMTRPF